jgi:hypothetical protein
MRRREFLGALISAATVWPLIARAQRACLSLGCSVALRLTNMHFAPNGAERLGGRTDCFPPASRT